MGKAQYLGVGGAYCVALVSGSVDESLAEIGVFFFKTILDNSRRLVSHSSNVLSISSLFVAFVCKIQIICLQQRLLICLYLSWYASFSVARCPGIIGRVLVACSS